MNSSRSPSEATDESGGNNAGITGGLTEDRLEDVVVLAGVVLLVGTLGYLGAQAIVTEPGAAPTAHVDAIERTPPGATSPGGLLVTVRLENEAATGLESVQVAVHCGGFDRSLVFTHVPARGIRLGTVACPAGTVPEPNVVTWVES